MKIRELFDKKTVFSFEIFPPKKTSSVDVIYKTLEELGDLSPDFISVTFSAGGSGNGSLSCEIASKIKDKYNITPMIHLPCVVGYISHNGAYLTHVFPISTKV